MDKNAFRLNNGTNYSQIITVPLPTGTDKAKLKNYAKRLMFADVPLIISGLMLIIYTGLKTFANAEIGILLNLGMSLFAIALAVLAIFHALEWHKSFNA